MGLVTDSLPAGAGGFCWSSVAWLAPEALRQRLQGWPSSDTGRNKRAWYQRRVTWA